MKIIQVRLPKALRVFTKDFRRVQSHTIFLNGFKMLRLEYSLSDTESQKNSENANGQLQMIKRSRFTCWSK